MFKCIHVGQKLTYFPDLSFSKNRYMLQKLFSLVDQTSVPDNPDSLQNQEILLPGHLITIYLKVQTIELETCLNRSVKFISVHLTWETGAWSTTMVLGLHLACPTSNLFKNYFL